MSPLFHERLHPGPFLTLIAAIFGAMMGVILTPVSVEVGMVVGALLAVIFPGILWLSAPTVSVSEVRVVAGKAHIDPRLLGEARVLSADEMRDVLGPDIRPLDFRLVRGWISTGVEVPVKDPEDPTPAWVLSLRRTEEFSLALAAVQAVGPGSTTEPAGPTAPTATADSE